jgi:hypothetical protein
MGLRGAFGSDEVLLIDFALETGMPGRGMPGQLIESERK